MTPLNKPTRLYRYLLKRSKPTPPEIDQAISDIFWERKS